MSAYTAYVIYVSYAVRFTQSAKFCPPPDRKDKRSDDYTESVGQLGLDPPSTYNVNLHYAIVHMRCADGALPPSAKGEKALDLLAGKGQSRLGCLPRYFGCPTWKSQDLDTSMRESSRNLEKLSAPLQSAKSLLTRPTIS